MNGSPLGRVVEVAEDGRHLAKDRGFLTVAASGRELGRVPLDDIAAVMATSPATTASCALLAELADRGIPFVLCGRDYSPAGMLWPVAGHHAQQRRMEAQLAAPRPLCKRLWAQVVSAKILRQGWTLARTGRPAGAFARLARSVGSGDPDNLEAQAARRYWPLLFGEDFRRDPAGDPPNGLLNYGYAVLRAATARAVVAAGLHPGLGIFHRHPNDAMPLADDLMEPFRPVIDLRVRDLTDRGIAEVTREAKSALVDCLQADQDTLRGTTPLATCLLRLAASVAESFLNGAPSLELPLIRPEAGSPDDAEEEIG